jgi:hypothetical protein
MTMLRISLGVFLMATAVWCGTQWLVAGEPVANQPSTYAPAADLHRQVDELVSTMEEDLEQEDRYNIPRMLRVNRDANTLAAVAVVLGNHDGEDPLKSAARPIAEAALALADNVADYGATKAALETLRKVIKTLPKSPTPAWQPTGDIKQLMLKVPFLSRDLESCVNGTSFAKSRSKAAGLSATLAAVAQMSELDHTYCSDAKDQRDWEALCRRMRDASANCNRAIRAGKRAAVNDAMEQLNESCDACHERFRD